jgi:cellulose synthase (UDP-forming)
MISPLAEVLSPGLALGAGLLALLPWLRRDSTIARSLFVAVSLFFMWRYIHWRLTESLPPVGLTADFIAGAAFSLVETATFVGTSLSLFFLSRTSNHTPEVDANSAWLRAIPPPLVDVCICTYNEEQTILERTIVGALALDHSNLRVWVLDDGCRPWLRELCARKGCGYITRTDNAHAKAGNVNNALAQFAALDHPPDFVAVLDADFVPLANFLSRTLPLFREEDVGLVQTPQHFSNPDPIQANLSVAHAWPDEQRYFFDVVMPSKDAWGAAFCCGTSAVIRFSALEAIGGFPTGSVTEDYLLTLHLHEIGYRTVYLNEKLSLGLAPEGLKEYTTQRARWCLGFMQICRGPSGPLRFGNGLSLLYRLSLIEAFLYWSASYAYRIACILVPIGYWLFNIQAVQADVATTLSYFIPLFVAQMMTMVWLTGGRTLPILAEVSQVLVAPEILKAAFVGLVKPKGHKFNVTAKGALRSVRVYQWRLLVRLLALLGLTIAGVIVGSIADNGHALENAGGLALVWSWYNIILLVVACVVCIEQPRYRTDERFRMRDTATLSFGGTAQVRQVLDSSVGGMRLAGAAPGPIGTPLMISIGPLRLHAEVARVTAEDFALRLASDSDRDAMTRYLYAGRDTSTALQVPVWRVMAAVLRRLFR